METLSFFGCSLRGYFSLLKTLKTLKNTWTRYSFFISFFLFLFLEIAFQASFDDECQEIKKRTIGAVYRSAMKTMIRFDENIKKKIFLVVHSQGRNRTLLVD
jgi:hypothetical protein